MPTVSSCEHPSVTCLNPYETVRKYECTTCHGVMMCACDEVFGRRHLPHQLHDGRRLKNQERVAVTLGFVATTCNRCRGLPEPSAPKAAMPGRTSKAHRYYWREISMRATERFSDWAEQNGVTYRPLLQFEAAYRQEFERIEREAVEEIKAKHERTPTYVYREKSGDAVLRANNIEVVNLDAIYVPQATKGNTVLIGGEVTSVEDLVSRHFRAQSYDVLDAESIPFHVLFGCLLCRVICDPSDPFVGAASFGERSAFERRETGPLITALLPSDFGTPGFGQRRGVAVEALLSKLAGSPGSLKTQFEAMLGESEPLRQYLWAHRHDSIESARQILNIVPHDAIVRILRYLAADYWGRYVGWPDLVVHRLGEYFFAEVKGSGDRLSEEQKRWTEANRRELNLPFKLIKVRRARVVTPTSGGT